MAGSIRGVRNSVNESFMHDVASTADENIRRAGLTAGFTLIELSIVLVIIGLIVGGVLVGQDLIHAAAVRATISQIENYNTAVNTFYTKYNGLPGDCANCGALGLVSRGSLPGEGDGNGVIQGYAGSTAGYWECTGETTVFWVDLSTAGLIDGGFNTARETACPSASPKTTPISTPSLNDFFPQAKLGRGNYIYVWSGGYGTNSGGAGPDGMNYFGVSAVQWIGNGSMVAWQGMTVWEASSIDTKIDDGLPQTGNVTALYIDDNDTQALWASGNAQTDDGAQAQ
jgi:prepilin-type N-terminal cleavage/methylation domain-containing protein